MKYLNSGIYCIVNKVNGKRYIGQAVDLLKRWNLEHKVGKKSNEHLKRAINKYGIQNFEFIVLEYLPPDKKMLTEAEQKWLDFYFKNDNGDRLYNICPNAETTLGLKRQPHEGQITSLRHSKKVFQFDLEGNFVAEWASAVSASRILNINNTHICHCRTGTRLSAGGFIWISENNEGLAKEISFKLKQPIIRSDSKKVIMIDRYTNEELKVFPSIRNAEIYLNLVGSGGKINMVISGKRPTAYGYKWKSFEE